MRRISAALRLTRYTLPLTLRRPRALALPSHEAPCQAAMAKGRSRSRCRDTQSSVRPQADECYALFSKWTRPNLVRSGSRSAWRRSAARPQQTRRSSLWLPSCATYGRGNCVRPRRHAEAYSCNGVFCGVAVRSLAWSSDAPALCAPARRVMCGSVEARTVADARRLTLHVASENTRDTKSRRAPEVHSLNPRTVVV